MAASFMPTCSYLAATMHDATGSAANTLDTCAE
jgi:hypothetical protein